MWKKIIFSLLLISTMLFLSGCFFFPEKTTSYNEESYDRETERLIISGRIIDATTSEPIPDVSVVIGDLSVSSDETGRWEISFPVSEIAKYTQKKITYKKLSERESINLIYLSIFKDKYLTAKKIIPISFNSELYNQNVFEIEFNYGPELVNDLEDACDITFYYNKGQYVYRIENPIFLLPKVNTLEITDIYSSLSPSFVGIRDLFSTCFDLEKSFPQKDKFETTEQYKNRTKNFKYPEIILNKFFAYPFWVFDEYNADKGLLKINLSILIEDNRIILDKDIETKEYMATNAFGAQVKVKSQRITNYGIAAKNGKSLKNKILKVYIPPEEAKKLISDLKGLIIFRLSPGDFPLKGSSLKSDDYSLSIPENYRLINKNLAVEYLKDIKPTFSNPNELFSYDILINTMLYEVIIYDSTNKNVILRLRLLKE